MFGKGDPWLLPQFRSDPLRRGQASPRRLSTREIHGRSGSDGELWLKPPPSDLTTLTKRHEGKYPAGYVPR